MKKTKNKEPTNEEYFLDEEYDKILRKINLLATILQISALIMVFFAGILLGICWGIFF